MVISTDVVALTVQMLNKLFLDMYMDMFRDNKLITTKRETTCSEQDRIAKCLRQTSDRVL